MLFVKVGVDIDTADHRILIPLHCVTMVILERKGIPETVVARNVDGEEEVYYTSEKGFYESVIDIGELGM